MWPYVFLYLGYIPWGEISGLYGNSLFNIFRNCQTDHQNRDIFYIPTKMYERVQIPPHSYQHIVISLFFHIRWPIGSYFPDQGSNPCPLQWKCNILTTGQPGKALSPISLIIVMPVDDMVAYYSFDLYFPND